MKWTAWRAISGARPRAAANPSATARRAGLGEPQLRLGCTRLVSSSTKEWDWKSITMEVPLRARFFCPCASVVPGQGLGLPDGEGALGVTVSSGPSDGVVSAGEELPNEPGTAGGGVLVPVAVGLGAWLVGLGAVASIGVGSGACAVVVGLVDTMGVGVAVSVGVVLEVGVVLGVGASPSVVAVMLDSVEWAIFMPSTSR